MINVKYFGKSKGCLACDALKESGTLNWIAEQKDIVQSLEISNVDDMSDMALLNKYKVVSVPTIIMERDGFPEKTIILTSDITKKKIKDSLELISK